jgi:D-arabinose 1-dehydrogenase-like Zn-dependent alcohol dehydrogenase
MADKMRAMVKAKAAPGLEMQLVDIPSVGPRDVLVKVRAASICGTYLHVSNLSVGPGPEMQMAGISFPAFVMLLVGVKPASIQL